MTGSHAEALFEVVVDDNFHYMDESERDVLGTYRSAEAAVAAARRVVDEFLVANHRPGTTAKDLYDQYTRFGEDPFIVGPGRVKIAFSAWDYARSRCEVLCGGPTAPP